MGGTSRLVESSGAKWSLSLLIEIQAEDTCKKASGRPPVARRHDGVV
jgi:hypothetical protein